MSCSLLLQLFKESSQFPSISTQVSKNCRCAGGSLRMSFFWLPSFSFESRRQTFTQVHTLLTVWKNHSHNNSQPLNSDLVEATYKKLLGSIEQVGKHPYHGPKLENTLVEWAQSGLCIFTVFYCSLPMLSLY